MNEQEKLCLEMANTLLELVASCPYCLACREQARNYIDIRDATDGPPSNPPKSNNNPNVDTSGH